jgi:hypothetical protein
VAFLAVLLHHRARGDLLGSLAVSALLLRALEDVFVLSLFLRGCPAQMFALWHVYLLCQSFRA